MIKTFFIRTFLLKTPLALAIVMWQIPVQLAFGLDTGTTNCLNGHPCKVVFTLDDENNIVLEEISGDHHRNEGVLRLTKKQAEKAAQGPRSQSNILKPQNDDGFFDEAIQALQAVPGLSFLRGEGTRKTNGASGRKASRPIPQICKQIKIVMDKTLEEANAEPLPPSAFITPEEIHAVCPSTEAENLISWYKTQKKGLSTH